MFEKGQRVRINAPGLPTFGTVRALLDDGADSVTLLVHDDDGRLHELVLTSDAPGVVRILEADGQADSAKVLAGMWTHWMAAAAMNAESSAMASTPLKPYAHQTTAVYGAMLPQPLLAPLLAS